MQSSLCISDVWTQCPYTHWTHCTHQTLEFNLEFHIGHSVPTHIGHIVHIKHWNLIQKLFNDHCGKFDTQEDRAGLSQYSYAQQLTYSTLIQQGYNVLSTCKLMHINTA